MILINCPLCGTRSEAMSGKHADDIVEEGCVPCRERWKETAWRLLATIDGIDEMLAMLPKNTQILDRGLNREEYPWGSG